MTYYMCVCVAASPLATGTVVYYHGSTVYTHTHTHTQCTVADSKAGLQVPGYRYMNVYVHVCVHGEGAHRYTR